MVSLFSIDFVYLIEIPVYATSIYKYYSLFSSHFFQRTYRSMASTASHKLLISLLVLLSITLAHSEDASADLTHTRGKREAELEAGSQIVHSSYGAFEDVVNGPPSATPSKVEVGISVGIHLINMNAGNIYIIYAGIILHIEL